MTLARRQPDPAPTIRLFLVDDEPVVRRGLRLLLGGQPDLEVCGEAETEQAAIEGIRTQRPELAVVDLSLEEGDGLVLIKRLHQLCPALKVLVFSMHNQAQFVTAAFAAGAHGYVVKEEGTERVIEAIHVIMNGGCYLSAHMAEKAPAALPRTKTHGRSRPA